MELNWLPKKERVVGLDILRSIAILMLLFGHGKNLLSPEFHAVHRLFVFDGVSIFFVLSGFLIGGILIRSWDSSLNAFVFLRNFWRRRWLRTLPLYFFVFFLVALITWIKEPASLTKIPLFEYLFFIQNFASPHPAFFPEAWSLSVEEWFYLLLPILWLSVTKVFNADPKKSMLFVAIGVILFSISFRFWRYSNFMFIDAGVWDFGFRKQVITRLEGIMIGVLAAYLWNVYPLILSRYRKLALVLGLICFFGIRFLEIIDVILVGGWYDSVLSFTIVAIGTAFLLPFLMNLSGINKAVSRFFTFISVTSYGMYLVNLTLVQQLIINYLPWNLNKEPVFSLMVFNYVLFWILTILFATLLYRFFERPILNYRDRK